jgi:hypothetical protein
VPTIEEIAAELERNYQARLAAGMKPISDLPGEGMGSFAEDDPELHQAQQNPGSSDDTTT